ncbi:iron deficiency-induced protein A [Sulfurifustis variabilis]|uniref:Iron deficiency-induced protein A n=1 Tax=Sulfurifustis variabilis TaxID=1675686 RepID=A0A1B4V003_9GAMM|nr:Fe(3+) ABC transporter substrate-binding protein [Sulfurifustis variabilis]BAU46719.1 iron deficiency-induced protein A [Sulfurifustis variabilis]
MKVRFLLVALSLLGVSHPLSAAAAEEVVVYSARNEQLIRPLFDAYTKQTGTAVRFITDKEGPLLERLKAEGAKTPADILLTVDAGNLWYAAEQGVLARVDSKTLTENVPAHLRDPEGRWYGLSVRARTIVYNPGRVQRSELSTYEALGDPKWKDRLCLRTSKKVYNQSLVAMMIARMGEAKTEEIVRAWVANLAASPMSDDTKVLEAIAAGQCDVGIVNTYYFGRLMKKKPALPLAIYWPNQNDRGVHVNVSGAGVTAHAKHRDAAIRLIEWLSSEKAQNLFADENMEYPANPRVKPHPDVAAWGAFKQDTINVSEAGRLQAAAVKLMDRAGYR